MSRHGRARGLSTREELDFNEHFCRSNAASQQFSGWEAFAKELDINLNECLWPGDKINRIITHVGQNDHTFISAGIKDTVRLCGPKIN